MNTTLYHHRSCILSKFYIKPQPVGPGKTVKLCCILSKFYIKPQQIECADVLGEVVSYRNSTSNHNGSHRRYADGRVVSYRNSTSNHNHPARRLRPDSVVSYRNSTSNHNSAFATNLATPVVSYRNSTSNHNKSGLLRAKRIVVSYRNSTSNHNITTRVFFVEMLYLIEILHQTTTQSPVAHGSVCCILSKFYIKPQHSGPSTTTLPSCILSKFYIKPQHLDILQFWRDRCILSKFYIKPQHITPDYLSYRVVSYRNSTSNHNFA